METFFQDIRYGLRILLRRPGFAAIAIFALALGIGATTGIFSVLNGVLIRPLGFKEPDRLVRVWEKWSAFTQGSFSFPDYRDFRDKNSTLESLAAYVHESVNLTGLGDPQRIREREVTWNFFSTLGIGPQLGRDFIADEDRLGGPLVTILTNELWKSKFGADPGIIGKTISLDGKSYTIVGVLPPGLHFYSEVDLYVPMNSIPHVMWESRAQHPGISLVGRLKQNVTIQQTSADLVSIAEALAKIYPDSNGGHSATVKFLYDDVVGNVRPLLLTLMAAVAFVLLIACANVANLLLARSASREREMAIRTALGAGRMRIVRQLLTESIVLSLTGGALGLAVAYFGIKSVMKLIPDVIPRPADVGIDVRVLIFAIGASLATGIIFGLAPALHASKPNLNESLKDGTRGSTGSRHRLRSGLVISEMALALILVIAAGLLIRSFIGLKQVNPGFEGKNALSFSLSLPNYGYDNATKVRGFFRDLLSGIRSIPGMKAAGTTTLLPLAGSDNELGFYVEGKPVPPISQLPMVMFYITSPGYTEAMHIPLVEGRLFDHHDIVQSERVALIDTHFRDKYFKGEDPIGKYLSIAAGREFGFKMRIVGVVGHVKQENLQTPNGSDVDPEMYMPFDQIPDEFLSTGMGEISLVARTETEPYGYVPAIRQQVYVVDRNLPIYDIQSMQSVIEGAMSQQRLTMILLGAFGAVALLLASIGIYGVISYAVSQRTHEIGIRMALGAKRSAVLGMIVGYGFKLAGIGVVVGIAGSLILTRYLRAFLFGVTTTDPITFITIPLALFAVALAASYIPARRALRVDPIIALRYE